MTKITAHTAKIAIRSGIGTKPERELSDDDRSAIQARKDAQAARLARIAERNA
jgi:hypothetical protein